MVFCERLTRRGAVFVCGHIELCSNPSEVWKKHWMPVMRKIAKKQRHQVFAKDMSGGWCGNVQKVVSLYKNILVYLEMLSLRLASEGEYIWSIEMPRLKLK